MFKQGEIMEIVKQTPIIPNKPNLLIARIKELETLLTISNDARKVYEKELTLLQKLKPQPGDEEYARFCLQELDRISENIFGYSNELCECRKQLKAMSEQNENSLSQTK